MNRQTVIGRLGQDAQQGKTKVSEFLSFSIAAESGYGERKRVEWIDCIKFGKSGVGHFLKKGTQVFISGDCWNEEFKGKAVRKMQVDQLELLSKPETRLADTNVEREVFHNSSFRESL